jgi:hypothetical protein
LVPESQSLHNFEEFSNPIEEDVGGIPELECTRAVEDIG